MLALLPRCSRRRLELLRVCARHLAQTGRMPTYRQIGGLMGLSSISTVAAHIEHLVDAGYLRRVKYGCYEITQQGCSLLAAHRNIIPIKLEHLASWVTCAPAKALILQAIDLIEATDKEEQ